MPHVDLSILEFLSVYFVTAVLFMITGAMLGKHIRFSLTIEDPRSRPGRSIEEPDDDDDGPGDDDNAPPDDLPDDGAGMRVPDYVPETWVRHDEPATLSRGRWPLTSQPPGRHRAGSGRARWQPAGVR